MASGVFMFSKRFSFKSRFKNGTMRSLLANPSQWMVQRATSRKRMARATASMWSIPQPRAYAAATMEPELMPAM